MFFDECETSLCVLFGQQWFCDCNSPMVIFDQCLSYCGITNIDLKGPVCKKQRPLIVKL